MPLNDFETFLKQAVGLDAAALGRAMVERAVRDRASACGLNDWRDYLEHVQSTDEEVQSLVDAVVAPEGWFFRDRPAFETLGRLAVQCWLTASHGDHLRLFSVGCGSGEEPYSMAMELLDCGFPAERIRIDAVDISGQALARARQAIYDKTSFRGNDLGFGTRYFTREGNDFKVIAQVRQAVTFFRGNVLSDTFLSGRGEYDFVFCRNLLTYFDADTQVRVVGALHDALAKNGVIFVGPGESDLPMKPDFVPVEVPGTYAFLKAGKKQVRSAMQTARDMRTRVITQPPKPSTADKAPVRTAMDLAERLAERGQWDDVLRLCEAHVRDHGASPQALYLLGRAHDVKGEINSARRLYERTLEMDSDHTLASLRLAQLPEPGTESEDDPRLHNRTRAVDQKFQP